jgi:hypothetical protein
VLEGVIVPGDFEKVSSFIISHIPDKIFLASPGGNLNEAMKIGRLVRAFKLETIAPWSSSPDLDFKKKNGALKGLQDTNNYLCASACFFVFVAGIHRVMHLSGDVAEGVGLAIHRPYMSDSDLRAISADSAISAAAKTRTVVDEYLKEMGVPAKYGDAMFAIPKDEVKWVDADSFIADLKGFVPELRDWVDARCNKLTSSEKKFWDAVRDKTNSQLTPAENIMADELMKTKLHEQHRCEEDTQRELAGTAQVDAIKAGVQCGYDNPDLKPLIQWLRRKRAM